MVCWQCYEGELDAVCTCGKGFDPIVDCDPGGSCCCPDCCGCEDD